jgi:TPR repeat protein
MQISSELRLHVHIYSKAAEHGDPLGQLKLAEMFAAGELVKQDFKTAARLFKAAIDQGEAFAHNGMLRAR